VATVLITPLSLSLCTAVVRLQWAFTMSVLWVLWASCVGLGQAADMARMTSSSSSSPVPSVNNVLVPGSYNAHKTSPSSTDTACSQDDDNEPLQLTSHARLPPVTTSTTTSTSPSAVSITSVAQSQLTLQAAANTLRWTGHGYEIGLCAPPTGVLFPAYCDANALLQTGTYTTRPVLVRHNRILIGSLYKKDNTGLNTRVNAMLISIHDQHTHFTASQFTYQEKCWPADNLISAVVNRRYKIRHDNCNSRKINVHV